MSFNWLHYLDLARELYEQAGGSGHSDANLRSSIGRAYYATYTKKEARFAERGVVLSYF